LTDAHGNNTW
jgi:hypothetical protein